MNITIATAIGAMLMGLAVGRLVLSRRLRQLEIQAHTLEAQLATAQQGHAAETALLNKQLEAQRAESAQALSDYKEEALKHHTAVVDALRQSHQHLIDEQDRRHRSDIGALEKRFEETIRSLREQVENTTNTMLKQRQAEFTAASTQNIDSIVRPLKETIDKMKEEMARSSTVQATMSAEIKTNMEHMIRQSIEAQKSAEELTRAFKHESKTQGDWGEVVLSNLLEKQGFTAGKDFETQLTMKDADGQTIVGENGNRLIPDVLLHLDDKRDVIIDSKVSMTAYIDYANADDEPTRQQKLKEHIASLKKHVDELSAKNYTQYQINPHLDFVIMFVPHVPALWAATAKEPSLWQDAMQKKVFIADEQTLYAALRIIRITWTHIDQERSHQRLYELAQTMVNRTGAFLNEFNKIGTNLQCALNAFENGKKKLLPGGMSISTTASQILALGGISNIKIATKGKQESTIIPSEYLEDDAIQPNLTDGD
ncbi:MAG: DNA recombination protein RmuC [Bacteroidales bacterium]|nr:DNA recombination protein RmuC [Bacteroidales bacterium]